MKLWKRIVFSVVSLVWGFVSLDYLYLAYRMLTGADSNEQTYRLVSDGMHQALGAGMFLLWFFIIAVYIWLIQKSSFQIDLLEQDQKTGEPKLRRKYFDLILQGGFILTGLILRWCYLVFILFPGRA